MRGALLRLVCVGTLCALGLATAADGKEIRTTVCGQDRCRTVGNERHGHISGVATLPGGMATPRSGRFYTVALRSGRHGWKVVYEARRGIVRAADFEARAFLGSRWARLTPQVRLHFDRAVRGLAPIQRPPR